MEKILIIRLKSIGDVLLTLPAVNALRANFPSARITFLTSAENATLLAGFTMVDEVVALDRAALRSGRPWRMVPPLLRLLHQLRAGTFSLVVDFQGYGETAWMSWFTGAAHRWGNVYNRSREWAYTHGIWRDNTIQIADSHLSLLRQCGLKIGAPRNEFLLPAAARTAAQKFFLDHDLDPRCPTLFLQAFTSSPQKDWPLARYLELAEHFRRRGAQVIFGGGPKDSARLAPARAAGFVVSAGVPLLVSAGLVALCAVTIGGVTGILHIAVAMQKRVVALIGPANEPGFPYEHRDWGLTPEVGNSVEDIPVATVIAACAKALAESAGPISG